MSITMLKNKGFYKGINIGGWLSQCDYSEDRIYHFITESDFEKINFKRRCLIAPSLFLFFALVL